MKWETLLQSARQKQHLEKQTDGLIYVSLKGKCSDRTST